ncbi:MAG: allantoinase AllB [Akkermansiaceae bacterium]|nr:allantoinase AllB [Akkermansiaceae bacterium]
MPDFDLLVRARTPDDSPLALGITDGVIAAAGPELHGSATEEHDFGAAVLLPGWIDAHVHFNEPGRADWEGLHSGSLALAAGGGTTFFDMPLNSTPPVVTRATLEEKRRIAEETSHLDFALWGGLTPDSLPFLEPMAEAGAVGFKAFMCHSGLDEFPAADARTLNSGMRIAKSLGLPVAVHAELPHPVDVSGKDMAAWLASRPIFFELDAIALALEIAGETGASLHIVHVTCPEGIDLVSEAKARGVDVTVETCPHYLLLDRQDAARIGPAAKCAPPLRSNETLRRMWDKLLTGEIDTIGSDHSPSPPDLKQGDDIFAMWGGIAGIQHGLPLMLSRSAGFLPQISSNVAERFRINGKGGLLPGNDADFFLLEPTDRGIATSDLITRHAISPYIGMKPRFAVTSTWLRGRRVTAETRGRFLTPTRS